MSAPAAARGQRTARPQVRFKAPNQTIAEMLQCEKIFLCIAAKSLTGALLPLILPPSPVR
jgi:hypothetical protein